MYIFETVFDVSYLILVIALGIVMCGRGQKLLGAMAIVLGCGDAFHLVPRVISMWSAGGFEAHTVSLGMGQAVTSITMTFFYVMLYFAWRKRYGVKGQTAQMAGMLALAVVRVVLCLMPQNQWTSENPPLLWSILRNLPFLAIGIWMIVLFYREAKAHHDAGFRYMWLAIAISFACYLPVVLLAGTFPPVGALMLPKTVAYVWVVVMAMRSPKL